MFDYCFDMIDVTTVYHGERRKREIASHVFDNTTFFFDFPDVMISFFHWMNLHDTSPIVGLSSKVDFPLSAGFTSARILIPTCYII